MAEHDARDETASSAQNRDEDGDGSDGGARKQAGLGEHDRNGKQDEQDKQDKQDKPRSKKPLIIIGILILIAAIVAIAFWLATRNQESTDDAFTDGNVVAIAPKVSGYVVDLRIKDNQRVKKGDLLLKIDPRDYLAARDQARAQVGLAQAQWQSAQIDLDLARVRYPAQLAEARAQRVSAQARLANADASYRRQHDVDQRATSQANIDAADAQHRTAQADVSSADAQVRAASLVPQQIRQAEALIKQREQQIQQAQAQLEQAELNLSYTEMRAPVDGWVTRRNVQLGTLLQTGTTIFSLVTPDVWITANYKESQLKRMRPGDHVKISVDAYPDLALTGHVDSIQLGSGSKFSAFPAENATGNFVKIVQRVPVKIVIDSGLDPNLPLPLGLSVQPTVKLPS